MDGWYPTTKYYWLTKYMYYRYFIFKILLWCLLEKTSCTCNPWSYSEKYTTVSLSLSSNAWVKNKNDFQAKRKRLNVCLHIIGALHTGTETGFTGSRSPVQIQCGLTWAPNATKTARIALLDWIPRTVRRSIACSSDPDQGRVEVKWSLDRDPRSGSDPDPRSNVESPSII